MYAIAAEEVLELKPARLVFYNLTTNEAVATTRDAKALAKTKQIIAEVADRIRAQDFAARPGFHCKYCDFEPLVPRARAVDLNSTRGALSGGDSRAHQIKTGRLVSAPVSDWFRA